MLSSAAGADVSNGAVETPAAKAPPKKTRREERADMRGYSLSWFYSDNLSFRLCVGMLQAAIVSP